jgi:hypothetical protein
VNLIPNPNEFEPVYRKMYIVEPKTKSHSNLIGKFKPKSSLIVVEPEPCDFAHNPKFEDKIKEGMWG